MPGTMFGFGGGDGGGGGDAPSAPETVDATAILIVESQPTCTKELGGFTVTMKGHVRQAFPLVTNSLTHVATLPAGFRPPEIRRSNCTVMANNQSSHKTAVSYIHTDGRVFVEPADANQYRVLLDAVRFTL